MFKGALKMNFILAFILGLTGCGIHDVPQKTIEPTSIVEVSDSGEFYSNLHKYVKTSGYEEENFVISPLSFRFCASLAALGAEGETQDKLLKSLGFVSEDNMKFWVSSVRSRADWFNGTEKSTGSDNKFVIANGIFHNKNQGGTFNDTYKEDAQRIFSAEVNNVSANKLESTINDWVKDNTNNLIPRIVDASVKDTNTVLVNTLYLKNSFIEEFEDLGITSLKFNTINGDKVSKDWMKKTDSFKYINNGTAEFISVPMETGMQLVLVKGHSENIEKDLKELYKSEYTDIELTMPKFTIDTDLFKGELVNYLKDTGADIVFSDKADFSGIMKDEYLKISNIVQKVKLDVDENGVEGAAVTAMSLDLCSAPVEPKKPKEIVLDEPFEFYVVQPITTDNPEPIDMAVLFSGQYVK